VARVELAPEVLGDFDRILDHLARFEVVQAPTRIGEITQALQILTHSPLIGRPVKGGKRELVIGRDSYGYIALYRFVASIDTVFVLAIRSQRERGFRRRAGQPK
jgi:plasmid stabilization system protein ParE